MSPTLDKAVYINPAPDALMSYRIYSIPEPGLIPNRKSPFPHRHNRPSVVSNGFSGAGDLTNDSYR